MAMNTTRRKRPVKYTSTRTHLLFAGAKTPAVYEWPRNRQVSGGASSADLVLRRKVRLWVTPRAGAPRVLLDVEVAHGRDYVSLAHAATGIYGAGPGLNEALSDFKAALEDFRDTLARQPELAPQMRRLLAHVNALV